ALQKIRLAEQKSGLVRLFSARHEFAADWYHFRNPDTPGGSQTLTLPLDKERFPFVFRDKLDTLTRVELYIKLRPEVFDTYKAQLVLPFPVPQDGTAGEVLKQVPWPADASQGKTVWLAAPTTQTVNFGPNTLAVWLKSQATPKAPVDPNAVLDLF